MTSSQSDDYAGPSINDGALAEIRAHMGRQRVNQRALAEAIGRDPFWLSRRMRAETLLTLDDMASIADALGVGVVDLLPSPWRGPVSPQAGGYGFESRRLHQPQPLRAA